MVNYNQKFILSFLAQLLHPNFEIESSNIPVSQIFWDKLVQTGSAHLVLPAIYSAIKRKKLEYYFPNDLMIYLKQICRLNKKNNFKILKQIAFISDVFNKNKIEYVYLKGSALLLVMPYDTLNDRMIGDIDILVSQKDLSKAHKILIDQGFQEIKSKFNFTKGVISQRHLKRLTHQKFISAVELHEYLFDNKKSTNINRNKILKNRFKTKKGDWVPSKIHLWLHAILNWQHNDNGFIYNKFSLRTYLDVVFLENDSYRYNLNNNKFVKHFYSLCSVLVNIYPDRDNFSSFIFKNQLRYFFFRVTFKFLVKIKFLMFKIVNRLLLMIYSKRYRYNILKNPKLLLNRILIYWNES